MFLKITVIAIVAIVAIVATSDDDQVWDGYCARWSESAHDGFYKLPTTMSEATKEGWTRVSGTKIPRGTTQYSYFGDVRFTLFFSIRTKKVVGHQVAVLVADIEKSRNPINYSDKPGFTKRRLNGHDCFTATAMFENDKVKGRRIWIEIGGKMEEIPTKTELIISQTRYYSKQCFKYMGNHFYQVNSTTTIYDFFPWFFLSVKDKVIGMGVQVIGSASSADKRKWYEDLDTSGTAGVIPDVSTELAEGIVKYGLISLHIYFRKNPMEIICSDKCTAVYNGTEESGSCRAVRKRRALGSGNVC